MHKNNLDDGQRAYMTLDPDYTFDFWAFSRNLTFMLNPDAKSDFKSIVVDFTDCVVQNAERLKQDISKPSGN